MGPGLAALAATLLLSACGGSDTSAESGTELEKLPIQRVVGGDADRGREVIAFYDCGVCHIIPGIHGAHGIVGPPLTDFAHRQFIAGVVPNDPSLLVRWVQDSPSIAPHTGMPDMRLSDDEARHVAAYLYTLR